MFDFNKKKISLSILLIALALIFFISKVKTKLEIPTAFDDTIDKNPTEWLVMDVVDLFDCTINYNNTLFVLLIIVIIAILLFVFTDDTQISDKTKSIKFKLNNLKIWLLPQKNSSPDTIIVKTQIEKSEEQIKFQAIQTLKSNGFLYGFIILAIQVAVYLLLPKFVVGFNNQIIINFSISLILRFFSAYKCNELAEYNKGNSNLWFLFAIMFPSITLILAGMDVSSKKEWKDYQYDVSAFSNQKTNKNFMPRKTIYLLIVILILVVFWHFKNSKSNKNNIENNIPEVLDSVNTAVAPDTTSLNESILINEKEYAKLLKDSISRSKREHLTKNEDIIIIDSLKKVKNLKPTFAEELLKIKDK
jgi:preprotein translocase subunit SecG